MTQQRNESTESTRMVTALVQLRQALQDARLPLELPDSAAERASRAEMVDQLEDYVIPRLMTLDAPLLAVVGGSTGAGKSTLVNSLAGRPVTEQGVLRPTTRSPVLVHHPDDARWFGSDRLLHELERVERATTDPGALQLVAVDCVPAGLAILDAPDIDSVEEQNRTLAAQLLAAADLWLFVTSAARYADQVPWDFLRQAAERSAAVAVVLDRTPPEAIDQVSSHLARMLASRGLKDSPLFIVTEGVVSDDGLLPAGSVAEVKGWLDSLAADAEAREMVVRQTLEGAVRTLARRTHGVADAAAAQSAAWQRLQEGVDTAYDGAIEQVDRATALETLLLEHAEAAAERAAASWQGLAPGQALLADAGEDVSRASRDFRRSAERAVRDWQQDVLTMVRSEGADKRGTARFLAYGVNGLGVAVMVVVFAHTGGVLVGAEAGVAGGTAIVAQKLLEAVFGDQAVRTLAQRARRDLEARTRTLLDAERRRYTDLLATVQVDAGAPDRLRSAARRVDDLRFAAAGSGTGDTEP